MSLQSTIKADMISAMKAKNEDVKSLLRVALGEISTKAKKNPDGRDLTDDEVLVILGKMKNDAIEMGNQGEVDILTPYLPTMLETKQLETLILGLISKNGYSGMRDMGKVMGELKSNHGGTYDGKEASQIVKDNL